MWNAQTSLNNYKTISGKQATNHSLILSSLPNIYYADVKQKTVIDQCRAWTLPANIDMITSHITTKPKIICLVRGQEEVRNSYFSLFKRNNRNDFIGSGYEQELFRNIAAVENAKQLPEGWVHWVEYEELINSTEQVLDGLYSFIGEDTYQHDLENIVCNFADSELASGLIGLHEVRAKIERRHS
jgi:sulfotransferase